MNIVYALSAYPLGALSDRIDRKAMLALGFATLIVADIVLAAAPNLTVVMIGVALWGLHMGMTQGLLSALVADEAPPNPRHRLRPVQLRERCRHAAGQPDRRYSVGADRPLGHLIAGAAFTALGPLRPFPHPPGEPGRMTGIHAKPLFNLTPTAASAVAG